MQKYLLSADGAPDLIILLDASHVESFVAATRAATGLSHGLNTVQESLGVLKSQGIFQAGRFDHAKAILVSPVAVEDFGASLPLAADIVLVKSFRNQCAGHLPAAMQDTMVALGANALTLIFHSGGPMFVIHPKEKDGQYRLASIRFEGARDIAEERACVKLNQASRVAYHDVWEIIYEKQGDPIPDDSQEEQEPDQTDLVDNPPPRNGTPMLKKSPFGGSSDDADTEDASDDEQSDDDDEQSEDDNTEHRSHFGSKRVEPEQNEADLQQFMIDEMEGLQF